MRLRQCQGSRPSHHTMLALGFILAVAFLTPCHDAATAATFGAFEVKASQLRDSAAEEQLEFALADTGLPIVLANQSDDRPAAATTAGRSDEAPRENATTGDAAKTAPAADKAVAEPASDGSVADAKSAASSKINLLRPGRGGATYYDGRASEVLKAEMRRSGDNFAPQIEPGMNIVVCVGGCVRERIGVVFLQQQPQSVVAASGEMEQSSTSGAGEAATQRYEIACIAGCYDDAPKLHSARTPEAGQREVQDAIDRATGKADRTSVKANDDWQTAVKQPLAAALRQTRRARLTEKPGAWLTRINRSRAHGAE